MEIGRIYFWTATINNWQRLLEPTHFKEVIIDSLTYLYKRELVSIYAFVIMHNHIHFIWRLNRMNGSEKPHASFLKYTSHQFQKMIPPEDLKKFAIKLSNKNHEIWKREPLAIELYTPAVAYQKLDYIHFNPVVKNIVREPADYQFSSAKFYETGIDSYRFLNHLGEEIH